MDWINYHHLFYFWMVAKTGTVSAAAKKLHLARPTVTAQVRELERSVGQKLLRQQGRGLVLTEFGQQIFAYAENIFSIGQELREFIKTGQPGRRQKLRVGMPDVVPKLIALAKKYRKGFPDSLTNAPILLPTELTVVRRSLDRWMEDRKVFPEIVAELEDSALLKVFGQAGQGVFPVPSVIEDIVKKQYGVWLVGRIPEVLDTFYVISVEKRVQHEAAIRIMNQARNQLFEN